MFIRSVLICAALCSSHLLAGEPAKPVKKPGDKRAVEMDYGPYMAITCGLTKSNIAYKGILIPLNKEKTLNVLFDTELLRVAGAWSGGFLNWASRNYADNNNDYCTADGKIEFATSRLPGWSHDGKRDDPRNPKDGPLAREWAKYKGLYLHGDQVVLSYTVGNVPVLETFSGSLDDGDAAVTRLMQIGPSDSPMELFAFEADQAQYKKLQAEGSSIVINSADAVFSAKISPPDGNAWEVENSSAANVKRAYLKIAPHSQLLTLELTLKKGERIIRKGLEKKEINALIVPGPAHWTQEISTKGQLARDDAPYVLDMLTAPEENPYKSWLRFTGLDFFPDGRAAVCTWNGDVWIISGIDEKLENLKWKRFATGLNNPMGIKIVDGIIHTIGRDQIHKTPRSQQRR